MVSSTISEIYYVGNASLVTGYSVGFPYLSASHVKVQKLTAGTGTVSITAGVATFTSAQTTLLTGSRFRISGTTYTIFSKTSTTVFTLTTEPTVASSAFHIIDDATDLVSGSTYTLVEVGVGAPYVTTAPAIAATDLVRVYRELPLTQLTDYPATGPLSTTDLEDSLDEKTMQIQQVSNRIDDLSVITNAAVSTTANDTTTFADAAARTAATPSRIGQLGVQLDTDAVYRGTALTAGSWTITGNLAPRYTTEAYTGLTPDYVGQLLLIAGAVPDGRRQYSLMYGYGTGVGQWRDVIPYKVPFQWQWTPWLAGDPLIPGQKRWAGNFPMANLGVEEISITCDTSGSENAEVKVHFVDLGTELTPDPIPLTPALVGSGALHSGNFNVDAYVASSQLLRVEVEIISTGDVIEVTSTEGSGVSTPDSGDLPSLPTGALISSPSHGDAYIVFVRGDGTIVRSHPATITGAEELTAGRRIFVRGIETGALTGGVTTIPATTEDLSLISPGDLVIGPSVPPFTVVVSKGVTDFEISNALTGATTLVTVTSPARPPVTHFKVISEAAGQTVIEVPTTATIRVGDRAFGEFVPATAYVTSIVADTSFTISSAISGGTATEITIRPPVREATVVAGTSTATLNHTVGLMVSMKVTGPGVPNDTYVTAVSSPTVTVSKNLMLDLSGAATDLFEFTREVLEATGTLVAGSTSMSLPYAVSSTPIEAGMVITGPGIRAGTLVSSVAGSTVTMSKTAINAQSSQAFLFTAAPAVWSGLQLSLIGYLTRASIIES